MNDLEYALQWDDRAPLPVDDLGDHSLPVAFVTGLLRAIREYEARAVVPPAEAAPALFSQVLSQVLQPAVVKRLWSLERDAWRAALAFGGGAGRAVEPPARVTWHARLAPPACIAGRVAGPAGARACERAGLASVARDRRVALWAVARTLRADGTASSTTPFGAVCVPPPRGSAGGLATVAGSRRAGARASRRWTPARPERRAHATAGASR